MSIKPDQKILCARIAEFLEYPVKDFRESLKEVASEIDPLFSGSTNPLKEFYSKMKRMDLEMWQEFYVQTFDLAPASSLYVSVQLFGEESFKRAELMAGLKAIYERQGMNSLTELPDHLAVILKQNFCFADEDWCELVNLCLKPALSGMISKLEKNNNPYSFILKSVRELLIKTEKVHV